MDKGLLDRLHHVMTSDFGHVTYTEAVKMLEEHNDKFDYKVFWGCDLQTEHERYLTEQIFKRPVFVTDYPKEIKAFYEAQPRRQDRRGHGLPRARHRRDHRRQPA